MHANNAARLEGDVLRTILTLALTRVSNLHIVDKPSKRTQYQWVGHDRTPDHSMCLSVSFK